MAGEDDLGAVAEEVLDGGDGGADTGVIGDVLAVVERHVEVGPHEHALPLEIGGAEVADALLRHGGHGARPAGGRRRAAARGDVDREPRVGAAAGRERQRPRRLAPGREPGPAERRGGRRRGAARGDEGGG